MGCADIGSEWRLPGRDRIEGFGGCGAGPLLLGRCGSLSQGRQCARRVRRDGRRCRHSGGSGYVAASLGIAAWNAVSKHATWTAPGSTVAADRTPSDPRCWCSGASAPSASSARSTAGSTTTGPTNSSPPCTTLVPDDIRGAVLGDECPQRLPHVRTRPTLDLGAAEQRVIGVEQRERQTARACVHQEQTDHRSATAARTGLRSELFMVTTSSPESQGNRRCTHGGQPQRGARRAADHCGQRRRSIDGAQRVELGIVGGVRTGSVTPTWSKVRGVGESPGRLLPHSSGTHRVASGARSWMVSPIETFTGRAVHGKVRSVMLAWSTWTVIHWPW